MKSSKKTMNDKKGTLGNSVYTIMAFVLSSVAYWANVHGKNTSRREIV